MPFAGLEHGVDDSQLKEAGYFLVLVTNQAGVGRGLMTEPQLRRVLDAFEGLLADNRISLDAIRYCPLRISVKVSTRFGSKLPLIGAKRRWCL